jgi:hypothetical protein
MPVSEESHGLKLSPFRVEPECVIDSKLSLVTVMSVITL